MSESSRSGDSSSLRSLAATNRSAVVVEEAVREPSCVATCSRASLEKNMSVLLSSASWREERRRLVR